MNKEEAVKLADLKREALVNRIVRSRNDLTTRYIIDDIKPRKLSVSDDFGWEVFVVFNFIKAVFGFNKLESASKPPDCNLKDFEKLYEVIH